MLVLIHTAYIKNNSLFFQWYRAARYDLIHLNPINAALRPLFPYEFMCVVKLCQTLINRLCVSLANHGREIESHYAVTSSCILGLFKKSGRLFFKVFFAIVELYMCVFLEDALHCVYSLSKKGAINLIWRIFAT